MPPIKTRKIDLNKPRDRKLFAEFLKSRASKEARENNFFEKDVPYRYKKNNIEFKNNILRRKRNEGKKGYRYEVIDQKTIGSGGFGKVHLIRGTYSPEERKFKKPGDVTKKGRKKARLVKIESVAKAEDSALAEEKRKRVQTTRKELINKEYRLTKYSNALSVKEPVFYRGNSYFVMEKAKGETLFRVLEKPRTVEQNIHLSIALLKALKEYIHDKRLIHADIKPENIIVDITSNPIQVKIIDFGLSTSEVNASTKAQGTLQYLPPEKLLNLKTKFTQKFDNYAMGLILAHLWGSSYLVEKFGYSCADLEKIANVSENFISQGLFEGYTLSKQQKKIMGGVIKGLLLRDPTQRWSSAKALQEMNLLLEKDDTFEHNSFQEIETTDEENISFNYAEDIFEEANQNNHQNLESKIKYIKRITEAYQRKLEKNASGRFFLKDKQVFDNKYAAICKLMQTLNSKNLCPQQIFDKFKKDFQKNEDLFKQSQDSVGGKRVKKAAIVLSLGIAKFGIWKREGKKYVKEINTGPAFR